MFDDPMASVNYAEEDDISNQELTSKWDIVVEIKDI